LTVVKSIHPYEGQGTLSNGRDGYRNVHYDGYGAERSRQIFGSSTSSRCQVEPASVLVNSRPRRLPESAP
jgi:hypothetical protein